MRFAVSNTVVATQSGRRPRALKLAFERHSNRLATNRRVTSHQQPTGNKPSSYFSLVTNWQQTVELFLTSNQLATDRGVTSQQIRPRLVRCRLQRSPQSVHYVLHRGVDVVEDGHPGASCQVREVGSATVVVLYGYFAVL